MRQISPLSRLLKPLSLPVMKKNIPTISTEHNTMEDFLIKLLLLVVPFCIYVFTKWPKIYKILSIGAYVVALLVSAFLFPNIMG
jgi:hypothetical protein